MRGWRNGGRLGQLVLHLLLLGLPVAGAFALASAVDYTLLRRLPYPEPDRIYRLRQHHPSRPLDGADFSPAQVEDLRRLVTSADLVTGVRLQRRSVRLHGSIEQVRTAIVARDYLALIGAASPAEEELSSGAPTRAADGHGIWVAHSFWLNRLAGDASTVGSELVIDAVSYVVEGILPPAPLYPRPVDILLFDEAFPDQRDDRANYWVEVLLRSAATKDRLDTELRRIAPIVGDAVTTPTSREGYRLVATLLSREVAGAGASVLVPLQASAVALLLLGVFNAWCTWYVAALARRHEVGIRLALGADPKHLMLRFVGERLAMSTIALGAGVYLGSRAPPLLQAFLAPWSPRHVEIAASGRAALATLALAIGLVAIAAPTAWRAAAVSEVGLDVAPWQRRFGLSRSQRRLQRLVIAAQAGVSFVVFLSGLSAVSKLQALQSMSLGFEPVGVVTARVELPSGRYSDALVQGFVERVEQRLEGPIPRHRFAVATEAPLAGEFLYAWFVRVEGGESGAERAAVESRLVSEGYFSTVGASFVQGRPFESRDRLQEGSVPVVVNQALVDRYWGPRTPPLGRRLYAKGREFSVVGVIQDLVEKNVGAAAAPVLYVPFWIQPQSPLTILVRTSERDTTAAAAALRATILREEPEVTALGISSMEQRYDGLLRPDRLTAALLSGFGVAACVLFFAGVGALALLESASRRLENVVRLVLGASPPAIWLRLAVSLAVTVAGGLLAGTAAFFALDGRIAILSFGPLSAQSVALGASALVLVAPIVAGVAIAKLPRRDLSTVLRQE